MMQAIVDFFSRLRPRSSHELMMDYLSDAKDIVHLEHLMDMWDQKESKRY